MHSPWFSIYIVYNDDSRRYLCGNSEPGPILYKQLPAEIMDLMKDHIWANYQPIVLRHKVPKDCANKGNLHCLKAWRYVPDTSDFPAWDARKNVKGFELFSESCIASWQKKDFPFMGDG